MSRPLDRRPGSGRPDRRAPRGGGQHGEHGSDLRFSAWNLLLLLPLAMLITGIYNHDGPHLFGLPFFYWFQLAFVLVGVSCVAIVYAMTRDRRVQPTRRSSGRAR